MRALLRRLHEPVYEKRLAVLAELMGPFLSEGESLLDVGCGSGELGALLESRHGVKAQGLEVRPREGCRIPVVAYDGKAFPFPDDAVDTVMLADVLHHEHDPARILREAARVAAKRVIVKDHKIEGFCAWLRISFIDWAANAGYGVPCLYEYYTGEEWSSLFDACGLQEEEVIGSIDLYPTGLNSLFGKRLQYLAVVSSKTNQHAE